MRGSSQPPEALGAVQGNWFGCPSVEGVYAWPPVATSGAVNLRWERGNLPFHVTGAEMQVWVQQARGETTLRTRSINRARNVRNPLARKWSHVTYDSAQSRCSNGMLDVTLRGEPHVPGGQHTRDQSTPRGFRLVPLKDGALAVGTRSLSTGRKGSFFSWGGQSYGTYDAPDVETWTWIKLARTGPGDKEPAAIDAYVPGATEP